MKITVLAVGKLRSAPLREVCADYLGRLQRFGPAEVIEVKAAEGLAPAAATQQECERLLKALLPTDTVWVLDERGAQLGSVELSEQVQAYELRSVRRMVYVLGGAFGLTDAMRKRGKLFSLSKLTLPHELCRALILEQLYRARTVQHGHPYHHA